MDIGNAVEESDETNNELQVHVVVVAPAADVTVTLTSQAALDGFRANNGGGNNTVDIRAGNGVMFGSPAQELVVRGFMSFDLSGIPATAQVQSIQLRFYQVSVTGTPYAKLGNLLLQHVDYGSTLNDAAFDTPVLHSAILGPHTGAGEWYNITSTTIGDWIESDLAAGRTRTQLRLQFSTETDGDGVQDTVSFESGENYSWHGQPTTYNHYLFAIAGSPIIAVSHPEEGSIAGVAQLTPLALDFLPVDNAEGSSFACQIAQWLTGHLAVGVFLLGLPPTAIQNRRPLDPGTKLDYNSSCLGYSSGDDRRGRRPTSDLRAPIDFVQ